CSQNAADDVDKLLPLGAALAQPARALAGDMVNAAARPLVSGCPLLPGAADQARPFEPIKSRVERAFLEPQRPRAGVFQAPPDLKAVRRAAFEGGEHHGLKMAAERVAADRFHAVYLDRLNYGCQDEST